MNECSILSRTLVPDIIEFDSRVPDIFEFDSRVPDIIEFINRLKKRDTMQCLLSIL